MSTTAVIHTTVTTIDGHGQDLRDDAIAVEAPLAIHVDGQPFTITMRTPGNDVDLVLGFLFCEGYALGPADIGDLSAEGDRVDVNLLTRRQRARGLDRSFAATSACGVCGKTQLADLAAPPARPLAPATPWLTVDTVLGLPAAMRAAQAHFARTGGLHAAALCDHTGRLRVLREDVGRHNAVDKVLGAELREGRTHHPQGLLMVSGRASFELVQKALMAQIPVLAAVGAPSSAALALAREAGQTLIGFLREGRFNVYTGAERLHGGGTLRP